MGWLCPIKNNEINSAANKSGEIPIKMSGSKICIPRNETVQPHYFPNRIIMFSLPVSTFMCLYLYIFMIGLLILLQPNKQTDPGNI